MKNSLFKRAIAAAATVPLALTQIVTGASAVTVNDAALTVTGNGTVNASEDNTFTLDKGVKSSLAYITPGIADGDTEDQYIQIKDADGNVVAFEKYSDWNDKVVTALTKIASGEKANGTIDLTKYKSDFLAQAGKIKNGEYTDVAERIFDNIAAGGATYSVSSTGDITIVGKVKQPELNGNVAIGGLLSRIAKQYGASELANVDFSKADVSGTYTFVIKGSELRKGTNVSGTFKFEANAGGSYSLGELPEFGIAKVNEIKTIAKDAINASSLTAAQKATECANVDAMMDKAINYLTKTNNAINSVLGINKTAKYDNISGVLKATNDYIASKGYAKYANIPTTATEAASKTNVAKLYDKVLSQVNNGLGESYAIEITANEIGALLDSLTEINLSVANGDGTATAKLADKEETAVREYFATAYPEYEVESVYKLVDAKANTSGINASAESSVSVGFELKRVVEVVTTTTSTSSTTSTTTTTTTSTDTVTTSTDTTDTVTGTDTATTSSTDTATGTDTATTSSTDTATGTDTNTTSSTDTATGTDTNTTSSTDTVTGTDTNTTSSTDTVTGTDTNTTSSTDTVTSTDTNTTSSTDTVTSTDTNTTSSTNTVTSTDTNTNTTSSTNTVTSTDTNTTSSTDTVTSTDTNTTSSTDTVTGTDTNTTSSTDTVTGTDTNTTSSTDTVTSTDTNTTSSTDTVTSTDTDTTSSTDTDTVTTSTDTTTDTQTTSTTEEVPGTTTTVVYNYTYDYNLESVPGFYLDVDDAFNKNQIKKLTLTYNKEASYYAYDEEGNLVLTGTETIDRGVVLDITDKVNFGINTPSNTYTPNSTIFSHSVSLYAAEDILDEDGNIVCSSGKVLPVSVTAYIGVKGDADLNNEVTSNDASAVLKYYSEISSGKNPADVQFSPSALVDEAGDIMDQFAAFLADVDNEADENNWCKTVVERDITSNDASYILNYYSKVSVGAEPGRNTWDVTLGK